MHFLHLLRTQPTVKGQVTPLTFLARVPELKVLLARHAHTHKAECFSCTKGKHTLKGLGMNLHKYMPSVLVIW